MKINDVQTYRDRLLDLHGQLTDRRNALFEAVQEEVQPPGEHDHPACEGVDADVRVASAEVDMVHEIEDSLNRIREGRFGKCVQCGNDIAPMRLEAVPYTPVCQSCARGK